MQESQKQLIKELDSLIDLGNTDNQVYGNLMVLLEILNSCKIIDNDCYEEAEKILNDIWGFDMET